ncbi:uncharacterized protein LOC128626796 [Artibeus jamaicensis]|uniref:uncharacterized protein LOC128626796 n=1 Tax=Artibeus jamaicensis TaxID=9417 RepID=UPI00235A6D43|nr:uncharacterized protein LOC128626796 [Artibeus jamaicensis]XP_053517390.1 uncharacterized protein LOC128626796 [Artibeus jamaicensis]
MKGGRSNTGQGLAGGGQCPSEGQDGRTHGNAGLGLRGPRRGEAAPAAGQHRCVLGPALWVCAVRWVEACVPSRGPGVVRAGPSARTASGGEEGPSFSVRGVLETRTEWAVSSPPQPRPGRPPCPCPPVYTHRSSSSAKTRAASLTAQPQSRFPLRLPHTPAQARGSPVASSVALFPQPPPPRVTRGVSLQTPAASLLLLVEGPGLRCGVSTPVTAQVTAQGVLGLGRGPVVSSPSGQTGGEGVTPAPSSALRASLQHLLGGSPHPSACRFPSLSQPTLGCAGAGEARAGRAGCELGRFPLFSSFQSSDIILR